jgi:hypothetical protein
MRTLSFLLWTTASVALGIWLATVPVGGRTPWEHAKRVLPHSGVTLPEIPNLASIRPLGAGASASSSSSPVAPAAAPRISERHTDQERSAVNKLVTRRAEK